MIQYLTTHPWKIVEEGFQPKHHRSSESIFSIGNGRFGQRANHEETYTGPTLQGSYVAGIYYPDKTRVGWWKNGYPEYFAKVLNSINWIGIRVWIDGEELDLAVCSTTNFRRELDMQKGLLIRSFDVTTISGKQARVESIRFCSMADDETAVIRYSVTPLNFDGTIRFTPYLDGDVHNHDSNYDEKFWEPIHSSSSEGNGTVITRTKKTGFELAASMQLDVLIDGASASVSFAEFNRDFYAEN
ncbi:MAG: glycoside hydrolase family 65 protein, partial [Flavobacteriales bacterium]